MDQNLSELSEDSLQRLANEADGQGPPEELLPPSASPALEARLTMWGAWRYGFLYRLAHAMQPSWAVELGTYEGLGALALACGAMRGTVVTIDNRSWSVPWRAPKAANIVTVEGDAADVPGIILPASVELLLVDAQHDGIRPGLEYERWLPALAPRHVVLFDDIDVSASMRTFWERFAPSRGSKGQIRMRGTRFGLIIAKEDAWTS